MLAKEVVGECLYQTGARGISKYAEEIALIGLVHIRYAEISRKRYRQRIRETFVAGHPEAGSVFLAFVLPLLISIISSWITKWILNRKDVTRIQGQAFDALTELSPSTTATLTSISTPQTKPIERREW